MQHRGFPSASQGLCKETQKINSFAFPVTKSCQVMLAMCICKEQRNSLGVPKANFNFRSISV